MASSIFGSNFGFSYDGSTFAVTGIVSASTAVSIGINPAQSGSLRLPNNSFVSGRNVANTGDGNLLGLDTNNVVSIGPSISNVMICSGATNPFLGFGSVTSASFVALKRSGTTLLVRVGDDSTYATLDTLAYKVSNTAGVATFGPSAVASLTVAQGIVTAAS